MALMDLVWTLLAIMSGLALAGGLAASWMRLNRPSAIVSRTLMSEAEGSITFLFDDEVLADATPRARALMAQKDGRRSDWENFVTLMAARYRGVRTVEYDGKRVTYVSDGEMAAALADLNRQIAGATDRISVVRIQSSKGL